MIDTSFGQIGAYMPSLEPTTANEWLHSKQTHSLLPPLSPEPLTHQSPDYRRLANIILKLKLYSLNGVSKALTYYIYL